MKKICKNLVLLTTLLSICTGIGCKSIMKDLVKSPDAKLDKVKVENVDLKSADLIFELEVFNPNDFNLKVDSVDYKLVLNEKNFADGRVTKITELVGGKKTRVPIPVTVEFSKVFDSLFTALQKPETEYVITGNAKLGPFSVPFNKKGHLKWSESQ